MKNGFEAEKNTETDRQFLISQKYLIGEIEDLREGFRIAKDFLAKEQYEMICMEAYHRCADKLVVILGGESVLEYNNDHTR